MLTGNTVPLLVGHVFSARPSAPSGLGVVVWADLWNDLTHRLTLLVIKLLIVAGAYLVGSLLGSLLAATLNRWVFRQRLPDIGKQLCSLTCGVLLAVLVALYVFGSGGSGLFGGGGAGPGTDTNASSEQSAGQIPDGRSTVDPPREPPSPSPKTSLPPSREVTSVIRVTVLAGRAVRQPERFYQLEDDRTPLTFTELTAALRQRAESIKDKPTLRIEFLPDPNLAPPLNDPKVTQLADWARVEARWNVTFPSR
ncbi:MAG: hypothetical protein NZU63_12765 [Gemmataceae bacterium]|nr:hypothetical protein [Gemmataceae bacterium]MDW8244199.1 hypothetical protein [Thermogemmata sp.]